MQITLKVDEKAVSDALRDVAARDARFVVAYGVTKLGQAVRERIQNRLPQVFDRPTDFTVRGVFLRSADKARPVAEVFFPGSQEARGKGAREYMRPGAEGAAARHQKKTEYLLSAMGFLPPGWVTVPGSFFKNTGKLDKYGNISGAYYKQIIRSLRIKNTKGPAKPASAASQKRAARMGVDAEFFAVATGTNKLGKNGGWLPSGVYKRTGPGGRKLQQYLLFVRRARYTKRLDLRTEAQAVIDAQAKSAFAEAVQSITTKFQTRR